ncbi:hypothetical protein BN1080_01710 [Planococcus massiliensis]|uniref:DUF3139 domain-containing protein n=1 Tax=Planococcus massiliensis TaxID=1499687 RepID=A0A098ELW7_9BACL|nr:hypothetical protein [Planococcus massiliensis]CEG22775.1 hypothetical protein BN1080_01710 [Planococcus massiliensis]
MDEIPKITFGVKVAMGVMAFSATLIILLLGVYGYFKYSAYQDAEELELLTEEHITNKYPDAKIFKIEADTALLGERLAHVVFEGEPDFTYSYGLGIAGIIQIKPNPPEDEKSQYNYLEQ